MQSIIHSFSAQSAAKARHTVVLAVGRVVPQKWHVETSLAAAAKLPNRRRSLQEALLVIVTCHFLDRRCLVLQRVNSSARLFLVVLGVFGLL